MVATVLLFCWSSLTNKQQQQLIKSWLTDVLRTSSTLADPLIIISLKVDPSLTLRWS